jgi:hypothetical protein
VRVSIEVNFREHDCFSPCSCEIPPFVDKVGDTRYPIDLYRHQNPFHSACNSPTDSDIQYPPRSNTLLYSDTPESEQVSDEILLVFIFRRREIDVEAAHYDCLLLATSAKCEHVSTA